MKPVEFLLPFEHKYLSNYVRNLIKKIFPNSRINEKNTSPIQETINSIQKYFYSEKQNLKSEREMTILTEFLNKKLHYNLGLLSIGAIINYLRELCLDFSVLSISNIENIGDFYQDKVHFYFLSLSNNFMF